MRDGGGRSSSVERPLSILSLREVACSTHAVSIFFEVRIESISLIYGPTSRENHQSQFTRCITSHFQVPAILVLIARGGKEKAESSILLSVANSRITDR